MKIVTHNASFHTDDVFAVASLFIVLGKENCTVIRSRDTKDIESGDYVLDVGGIYDAEKNRFDHHQEGGSGTRENTIPYASFGLVWKKFGKDIAGSIEIAETIDQILVQPIDAGDNGFSTFTPTIPNVFPALLGDVVSLYKPTLQEPREFDKKFLEAVDWAIWVIQREVKKIQDSIEAENRIREVYQSSLDKQIIIFDEKDSFGRELTVRILNEFPEPVYAVLYRQDHGSWQVVGMRKEAGSFETRKPLPEPWRAKTNEDLASVTGVQSSIFCHRSGFMCVAGTKEDARTLAQIALNA